MTSRGRTMSNQRWNNLAYVNDEFATLNNIVSTLSISTLIWTMLHNVETTLSFSTLIFTTLGNVETMLWIWPFKKNKKLSLEKKIKIMFFSLKYYAGLKVFSILFPILRGICKRIFAEAQILKRLNTLNYKNYN